MKQRRFEAKIELKEYFNKDPGPGAYAATENVGNVESQSKRGFLNGFVSKADRFHLEAGMLSHDPTIQVGPG